jgi:hypothetical protein
MNWFQWLKLRLEMRMAVVRTMNLAWTFWQDGEMDIGNMAWQNALEFERQIKQFHAMRRTAK